MTSHDDMTAEQLLVVVETRYGSAFVGGQNFLGQGPAVSIEMAGQLGPREGIHPLIDAYPSGFCGCHETHLSLSMKSLNCVVSGANVSETGALRTPNLAFEP